MAATALSINEMLGFVPLTEAVKLIVSGIPRLLPPAFWSTTEDILGNKHRHFMMRGNRRVSKITGYGAPPVQVNRLPLETEDVMLIHTIEELNYNTQELLGVGHKFESYEAQLSFIDELNRQIEEFAMRFANLETATVNSMVANMKLWFDGDGDLLSTSAGATLTVDYGVPAGNVGSIGGIIEDWSLAATNIPKNIVNLKARALQLTGYPLKYAYYGKNVAGYLATNTSFKDYLARNPGYNQKYIDTGEIADGTLGLTWIPIQAAFFDDQSGVIVSQMPDDQVTFGPEVNKSTYAMYRGSYRVPKSIQPIVGGDLSDALANTEVVYGMFRFAQFENWLKLKQVIGHTFLPKIKQPEAWFLADTKP